MKKSDVWAGYIFGGIFALAGLVCGAVAIYMLSHRLYIINQGEKTTGTVTDILYQTSKGSVLTAPVVTFRTQTGDLIEYRSSLYSSGNAFNKGDEVTLWYNPERPDDVILAKSSWLIIGLCLLFMCTHGGVGFYMLYTTAQKWRLYNCL